MAPLTHNIGTMLMQLFTLLHTFWSRNLVVLK